MPLTKATDDDAFVEEISREMLEQAQRNREHNAAMIEEYLRRRVQAAEAAMKVELAAQETRMYALVAEAQAGKAAVGRQLSKTANTLQRVAAALGTANSKLFQQRALHHWLTVANQRAVYRQRAVNLAKANAERAAHHALLRLSLFAAAKRQGKEAAAEATRLRCEVEELKGHIDVFKEQLETERGRNEDMDEKLKAAFLRGVSAVNREAMQVLRGGADTGDTDVTAIEEILSGGGGNTRKNSVVCAPYDTMGSSFDGATPVSTPMAGAEAGRGTSNDTRGRRRPQDGLHNVSTTLNDSDICPVHHTDSRNNFYHRCYAPASCEYGPHGHPGPGGGGRTPFLVRGDLDAAPSYVASPPTRKSMAKTAGFWKQY